MTALYIILGIALLLTLLLILGAYIAYRLAFAYTSDADEDVYATLPRHPELEARRRALIDDLLSRPCEEVRITSRDGLPLYARYYHVRDGAPIEIHFHGYKSMSRRDFSASGMESARVGYNLLLIDQRAHGNSGGRVISFGIKERFDAIDWVGWVRERFGEGQAVLLYGISMGAATVLMAAGEPTLPDSVVGVVADCPYSSPVEIIAHVARRMHIPTPVTRIIAPLGARLFGGFSLTETSPVEAVARARVPILLIHGDADRFVPYAMSVQISAAGRDVRFVTVEGAGHGFSYLVDTERYTREADAFLWRCVNKKTME